jgi:hypothetical protein
MHFFETVRQAVLLSLCAPAILVAHTPSTERDTAFTIASAAKQVHAEYPFARPVVPQLPNGVIEKRNIVYEIADRRELHLDLFRPEDTTQGFLPGVVLVH